MKQEKCFCNKWGYGFMNRESLKIFVVMVVVLVIVLIVKSMFFPKGVVSGDLSIGTALIPGVGLGGKIAGKLGWNCLSNLAAKGAKYTTAEVIVGTVIGAGKRPSISGKLAQNTFESVVSDFGVEMSFNIMGQSINNGINRITSGKI
ncbi:hypothetical protein MBBAR_3c00860 [Methanobrevibacter arboriphilus JCM 13429 = DSM 1125]|uniref:Uncharacterized protein n=1 Tax=Methanobrevibacter arboriphilus JCM 13429 = DSM 1125 TaxID=1300164 RepID=A0A1V6N407_METAZ|nr:hypothetical protein [Methanobrevibacter arboriphilus]OQD59430.1 hypothetical protein MBBAR_3c00860 [Methanobrevibacter arboriphilus JCM 13429 = DSM 1125]